MPSRDVFPLQRLRFHPLDLLVERLPVLGDPLLHRAQRHHVFFRDQIVQSVLELVLQLVSRRDVALFGEEVGDVVRATKLKLDDVVDLEGLSVLGQLHSIFLLDRVLDSASRSWRAR
jgi:hypothetical protein